MADATRISTADRADSGEGLADGTVYGAFVSRVLADQRELKDSLERRATGIITSSGILVTLLFGLTTITAPTKGYRLPHSAHGPLIVALVAFVVSFGLAVAVSIPFRFRAASPNGLERIRLDKWHDREWVARRRVAGTEIDVIRSYRRTNAFKAWFLVGAGVAQLVALGALGATVWIILST